MVLMNFSEPSHVAKLLDGHKVQTTRKPRSKPLEVGDILHCWYMSRVHKGCINCIQTDCKYGVLGDSDYVPDIKCNQHTNFFGTATVTEVEYVTFANMPPEQFESWAVADGFDDMLDAIAWFTDRYGPEWEQMEWTVIHFEPDWIEGVD